jgi:FkbM family methyltransferase
MASPPDPQALADELARLRRRQARNERAARARGLMSGICAMLRPGDVVLDCGANVGDVAEPLAATGARVIAFEPDPWAFERLSARLGAWPNVTLHQAAVGVADGHATLRRADNFGANPASASVKSTLLAGGRRIDDAGGIEVAVTGLPDLIAALARAHGTVALLKLDVEGAELDILAALLDRALFDRIRLTLAETHEKKFKALRPRFAALRARIAAEAPPGRVDLDWI